MRLHQGTVLLSATDLVTYLGCRHASALDFRRSVLGEALVPSGDSDASALVKRRGDEHERRHFEALRAAAAGDVVWLTGRDFNEGLRATTEAMRRGAGLIYQGVLSDGGVWHGYADFLVRAEHPSGLGSWSYEVHDTKLARSVKAKFAVQLALYADMLARAQGADPPAVRLVLGDGSVETLRPEDYRHYVRLAMRRLERAVRRSGPNDPGPRTAAEPCGACLECDWRERCAAEWEANDHLHRVANIRRSQVERLREAGVTTMAALAELPPGAEVPGMGPDVVKRLRSQALLQVQGAAHPDGHLLALLAPGPGKGLARLPEPDPHDLFFDMEGDPLYPGGGLEYLFGVEGRDGFKAFWALDRGAERAAFEAFMDHACAAMAASPGARIYHYNHYETTALKRLAMTYGAREAELDGLLRQGRFVDLLLIVREGVRISEPSYSLKHVERFYRPARQGGVGTAADSIVAFERWLELREQAILEGIEAYNRDDCASTRELRQWLVGLRPAGMPWSEGPVQAETPDQAERRRRREEVEAEEEAVRQRLLVGVLEAERGYRELVSLLVGFHRRERKPVHWAMFDRQLRTAEELADDHECLGGLEAAGAPYPFKKSVARDYRFPPQDTKLSAGKRAVDAATLEGVTIQQLDQDAGTVTLSRGAKGGALPDALSLGPDWPIDDAVLRDAVRRFVENVQAGGGRYRALESVLRRELPRLSGRRSGDPIRNDGETALSAANAACRDLDGSYLFVQGPPGTGKTWTASRMALDAIRRGCRVGVSAFTHKAINNLLLGIEAAAREAGAAVQGCKRSNKADPATHIEADMIRNAFGDDEVPSDVRLVGGTAWYFAGPDREQAFDYLFVDESGQVSLANLVAMGTAARNLVLVGDQMQLGQPVQGTHPGGSGASALAHLLQGAAVVPPERGLFLAESHRMHPDLCGWVSEAIYDGQLVAHPSCAGRALLLGDGAHPALMPSGLRFHPVEHTGRSQRSDEEVAEVAAIWRDLMRHRWRGRDGVVRPVGPDDVLVVAPWNVQVNALRRGLPEGARVGTVDRFQGQEAAVVLISMATSAAEDIPRGLDFLFSQERLNVAVSRARCLAIVLASPALLETPCATVGQLRLVNTLCSAAAWRAAP